MRRCVFLKVAWPTRSVLRGKPCHIVASLKPDISPPVAVLKESFVPFWEPSSGGHFVWKHHSRPRVRFLWKTTPGGAVRVSASQHAYWLAAPQRTTPSICVSGVEAPQEWEYLSTRGTQHSQWGFISTISDPERRPDSFLICNVSSQSQRENQTNRDPFDRPTHSVHPAIFFLQLYSLNPEFSKLLQGLQAHFIRQLVCLERNSFIFEE